MVLVLLILGGLVHLVQAGSEWSYFSVYVSLMLLAFMNPIINALRPHMRRNTGISAGFFLIHCLLCFGLFSWMGTDSEFYSQRLFMAIMVFYAMAIILSLLYRGVYLLVSEQL